MTGSEPTWGEPPIPDVLARLLRERWSIPKADRLTADVHGDEGALSVELTSGRSTFRIRVTYRAGAGSGNDPWMLLADAVDALVGQLQESGHDHRALPAGEGVAFQGATFRVEVEKTVPELQRLADRLLGDAEDRDP